MRMAPLRLMSTTSAKTAGSSSRPRAITPAQLTSTSSAGEPGGEGRDGVRVAHVERPEVRRPEVGVAGQRVDLARRQPGRGHRAGPGEGAGDGGADARGAAGDEDPPAGEPAGGPAVAGGLSG